MIKRAVFVCFSVFLITFPTSKVYADNYLKRGTYDILEELRYQTGCQVLKPISVTEIRTLMKQNKEFYLYTGRPSCPYCRNFVPRLAKIVTQKKIVVYYLNSEKSSLNQEIVDFRKKYNITTVPNVSYFNSNQLKQSLFQDGVVSDDTLSTFFTK